MNEALALYDYCICFIDNDKNREIAERLFSEVSSYKLPKKVKDFEGEPAYKKGCLMPLNKDGHLNIDHENLLKASRWLMVICTIEARDTRPINQAIHYYIVNKGRAYILPILLEGEPQDAFPPEFFEERTSPVTFADGSVHHVTEIIEPLAIDIRSKEHRASLSLLHHVRIKVIAALISVSYDTLEQRHEKRARRRLKLLAAVGLSIPLALGAFFTYLWINAEYQIDIAIQKTQVSKDLLANMCQHYPELFKDIPEAGPILDVLLIDSLEKLRVVESQYIPLLGVDALLVPNDDDDLGQTRSKAKILRYLGKTEDAVNAYIKISSMLDKNNEIFRNSAIPFAKKSPEDYPNGILILSIDENTSEACDGLKSGDIIVMTKGFKFRNLDQYHAHIDSLPPDQTMEITILRLQQDRLVEKVLKVKPKNLDFISEEI